MMFYIWHICVSKNITILYLLLHTLYNLLLFWKKKNFQSKLFHICVFSVKYWYDGFSDEFVDSPLQGKSLNLLQIAPLNELSHCELKWIKSAEETGGQRSKVKDFNSNKENSNYLMKERRTTDFKQVHYSLFESDKSQPVTVPTWWTFVFPQENTETTQVFILPYFLTLGLLESLRFDLNEAAI